MTTPALQTMVRGACLCKNTCAYPQCGCSTIRDIKEAISALDAAGLVIVLKEMKPVVEAAKNVSTVMDGYPRVHGQAAVSALFELDSALAALEAKEG